MQLDDNLVPINIVEIDMSKLHQAAQIRVGEFRQSIELEAELHDDEDEEQADVTYLSFVAKRADRGSSAYFINALGCEVGVSSTKATTRLYKAVDAFFRENDELNPYLRTAKDALSAFLRQEADAQRLVTMDALQDVMDRVVRPEHAHLVREMTQTLNGDRFKVPDGFLVSETVLRKHTKVVLEGARLTLKFDRAMLGTDRNAELFFDEDNRTLTIQNLSDEMIGRLQQTLNDG
ncbi:hypothetical protein AYM40_16090 [Paraburkholderia phytofirmans OLGA172]|uniref:Nucleoid-associated protein n=1 Tax=Paraburkholderia phytofirmans OLGA172 TaxID=1417228 RepID=A0A160FN37_9BURK|nr:hypothetical protein AYM40_16090 [Paraburkholderia phytofirmans OLGA172]